jgi:hypothetical protein
VPLNTLKAQVTLQTGDDSNGLALAVGAFTRSLPSDVAVRKDFRRSDNQLISHLN